MISINIDVKNPFKSAWLPLWSFTKHLTAFKVAEARLIRKPSLMKCSLEYSRKCDYAGLEFEFGLFGYCFSAGINDIRAWNYQTNTWDR